MRALLIFGVIFSSYTYFYEGAGWNQNSRLDMVRAIVEQGTLRIDDFQGAELSLHKPERFLKSGFSLFSKAPNHDETASKINCLAGNLGNFGRVETA